MSTSEYAFKLSQKLGWPHTLEEWRIMENAGTLLTLGESPDLDGTAVVTHYELTLPPRIGPSFELGIGLLLKVERKSSNEPWKEIQNRRNHQDFTRGRDIYRERTADRAGGSFVRHIGADLLPLA